MPGVVDLIEPALCMAKDLLAQPETGLFDALGALRSVRDRVDLHRPPAYVEYSLGRLLDAVGRSTAEFVQLPRGLEGRMCVGDPAQIQVLLQALIRNAVLDLDAELKCTADLDGEVTYLQLSIDGPGRFPDIVDLGFGITTPFVQVEELWTIATRGGRIDRLPAALALRLKGIRVVPAARNELAAWTACVTDAETKLRLLAGGESGLPRERVLREILDSIEVALVQIDSARKAPEPSDLRSLIADTLEQVSGLLTESGIAQDLFVADSLPPIVLRRNHIAASVLNAARLALAVMKHGGTLSILADYQPVSRLVELVVALDGKISRVQGSPYCASIRRAVTDLHGGRFEMVEEGNAFTMRIELPDTVGRTLEEWIPGFERFSDRSKQMLRLLKSGGPTPPEDFILGGVLEEELERWLLPRLAVAPATLMAHELARETSPLPGSVPDRRSKALAQIARGRPKKEVCQPAYAAEVLWAFRIDERHRKALGMDRLSESVLKSLCEELLKTPIDYAFVLRLVASALS